MKISLYLSIFMIICLVSLACILKYSYSVSADSANTISDNLTSSVLLIKANKDIVSAKTGDWLTTIDIVAQVAKNMSRKVDVASANDIQQFIDDFGKLSYSDRVKYGFWDDTTEEGKLQIQKNKESKLDKNVMSNQTGE